MSIIPIWRSAGELRKRDIPRAVSATTARTIVLGARFHAPYKRGYPTHNC